MIATRGAAAGLVILLVVSLGGLGWATTTTLARGDDAREGLSVQPDKARYARGEPVRVFLRNTGDESLLGTPRILILADSGSVQRAFSLGEFQIVLNPGDAVWVDWATHPARPSPCYYGRQDAGAAFDPEIRAPCPDEWPLGGGSSARGTTSPAAPASSFLVVGSFADRADAAIVTIA